MRVKAIAITKPIDENLQAMSPEELTAFIARVSNPGNQLNNETAPKLLGYCIKHQHWSVFEHVSLTVEITTSRAIAAQILRHRSFVFQEFSQRYAEAMDNEKYPARRQDNKNRQNSIDDMSPEDNEWFDNAQELVWENNFTLYQEALERKIAKEQARFLLPLSTRTTLYMTGNLRSWVTYCKLRCEKATQLEHREIAKEIWKILQIHFPNVTEAVINSEFGSSLKE